ncbi:MAG: imidazole glycerol phosphate synthase subunit HisH [Planctomycetaceae bacterium]
MITIVDYGMGNLRSVQKACEFVGASAHITSDPAEIAKAEKLILPGVGAFRDAIHELGRLNLVQPVKDYIASDKPFLGICLGLQLLFEVSYEEGEWQGLGVIPGKVVRFPQFPDLKVPHMGWNTLILPRPVKLLENIPDTASFYFVHSFYVVPEDESVIAARTDYGVEFTSMVSRGNLFATQFHPEKSQKHGLQLIRNFVNF